jgi:nitric oxide reductase subunit C
MNRCWIASVPRLLFFLLALLLLSAGCSSGGQVVAPAVDQHVAQGKRLFNQNCATCHAVTPGTMIVGPSLSGVASRAASRMEGVDGREYLLLSIIKPSAYVVDGFTNVMPSNFGKSLDGEQLDALVAYLLTLS